MWPLIVRGQGRGGMSAFSFWCIFSSTLGKPSNKYSHHITAFSLWRHFLDFGNLFFLKQKLIFTSHFFQFIKWEVLLRAGKAVVGVLKKQVQRLFNFLRGLTNRRLRILKGNTKLKLCFRECFCTVLVG